jgi:hypothetical protein
VAHVRALVGGALLVLGACGGGGGGGAVASSGEDIVVGAEAEGGSGPTDEDTGAGTAAVLPDTSAPSRPVVTTAEDRAATGNLDLLVVDPNGTPRGDLAVHLSGPGARTLRVDADGRVRTPLPPGDYRAEVVEGCVGQLQVLRGGSAALGVAAGRTTGGRLVAEVAPRFEVHPPAAYDGDAGWRVGEVHRVRFPLVDACREEAPPSLAAYRAARFEPSAGVEVVAPLSGAVDEGGVVELRLRCTSADVDVALAMVDALDPRRRTEIFTKALFPEQNAPFCLE